MKISNTVTVSILDNGLTCVHIRVLGPVGYCGLAIRAGSRDENLDRNEGGLAHFVEHCIFKGTARRSADDIRNRMEQVGGELNAFTGKDDTVVYTVFPSGNTARALELVADLTCNSVFPEEELEKEREVVEAEIDSYLDTPSEQIFDDFEDLVLHDTPLGHNILGSAENLTGFSSAVCRSWIDRYYTACNCVLFYAGTTPRDSFERMAGRYFGAMPRGCRHLPAPLHIDASPLKVCRRKDTHQSHVVMGTVLPEMSAADFCAMQLLSNITGGPGMNALLNVELRERRGLVYTVETSASFPPGCTLFTVYFGCDAEDADLCKQLVRDTFSRLADKPLTPAQLAAARRQYLGQMVIANDNKENRAIAIARSILLRGHAYTGTEIRDMLDAVPPERIAALASTLSDLSVLEFTPGL